METKPTVFIVDDDEAVRKALRLLIKSAGYGVETYGSAQEFLDAYDPTRLGCLVLGALEDVNGTDVVILRSHVDPEARRTLFRSVSAVLANSEHEPFGLVGLETMAAGGIACTGCSGEDYAIAGQNALVLETADPREFVGLFERLRANPAEASALRRSGRSTAQRYAWPQVARGVLLPRIELARAGAGWLRQAPPLRSWQPTNPGASGPHAPATNGSLGLNAVINALLGA